MKAAQQFLQHRRRQAHAVRHTRQFTTQQDQDGTVNGNVRGTAKAAMDGACP
jgi:hypothetical protein